MLWIGTFLGFRFAVQALGLEVEVTAMSCHFPGKKFKAEGFGFRVCFHTRLRSGSPSGSDTRIVLSYNLPFEDRSPSESFFWESLKKDCEHIRALHFVKPPHL